MECERSLKGKQAALLFIGLILDEERILGVVRLINENFLLFRFFFFFFSFNFQVTQVAERQAHFEFNAT